MLSGRVPLSFSTAFICRTNYIRHRVEKEGEEKVHKVPTLVMGGDRKVFGVDERRGSEIIFENIPDATLALFKDAFDPLSTMKKDIFNEMVMGFLEGKELKPYNEVHYADKVASIPN